MMATNAFFQEGQSLTRPPLFNGENYPYWKKRMENFVQSVELDMWDVIIEGPHIPYVTTDDGRRVEKIRAQYTEADKKKVQLNHKAMNTLLCSLTEKEFSRVQLCENAKEVWETLKNTYEGIDQVKETKMTILTYDYEMFRMKDGEGIEEMFARFTKIIGGLKALGHIYPNKQVIKKVLNSLPKSWEPKVTAIEESKDLNTLGMDELLGSLITYELKQKHNDEKDEANKAVDTKKKGVALKSTQVEVEDEDSDDIDEDIAMLSRRIGKFMRRRNGFQGRRDFKKGDGSKGHIICYECRKPGHTKYECPNLSNNNNKPSTPHQGNNFNKGNGSQEKRRDFQKKFKKKAMVATWSDEDDSQSEEEEQANLCLMAQDEPKVNLESSSPSSLIIDDCEAYTFDELQDAYEELACNFEFISLKYKKKHAMMKNENALL